MIKKTKGFTIIELIVVIAIIAILAAIVIVNVVQYINRAKDAATIENLNTLYNGGEAYKAGNSYYNYTYTGFWSTDGYLSPYNAIYKLDGYYISPKEYFDQSQMGAETAYCICVPLKSGKTYCIDSVSYKKETSTDCSERCTSEQTHCSD